MRTRAGSPDSFRMKGMMCVVIAIIGIVPVHILLEYIHQKDPKRKMNGKSDLTIRCGVHPSWGNTWKATVTSFVLGGDGFIRTYIWVGWAFVLIGVLRPAKLKNQDMDRAWGRVLGSWEIVGTTEEEFRDRALGGCFHFAML